MVEQLNPTKEQLSASPQEASWDNIITSEKPVFDLRLREVWQYRDLLYLIVRRDFIALYKQTILGPIWFFIQPLLMSLMFTVVFGNIAGIPTDGIPKMVFYLSGFTIWSYFAEVFKKTSTTFKDNQQIFGKVYFPRVIAPISITITNILRFFIQLLLFIGFYLYYLIGEGIEMRPNAYILLLPFLMLLLAMLSIGMGLIITSFTTKYRDLVFLLQFGIRMAMYATPVIIPLSQWIKKYAEYKWIALVNPVTSIIETFRYGFIGRGAFEDTSMMWMYLGYSAVFTVIVFVIGVAIFNRTEKNFMDTV
ncbi:MAG: ABC transporter permease [Bacteroidota bacterium]